MKYFLAFTFSTLIIFSYGQIKPDIFPEDLHIDEIKVRCFCKPGVANKSRSKGIKLSYTWSGDGTYKKENGTTFSDPLSTYRRMQNVEFGIKIPVIRKDRFKLLLGYKYIAENFNFRQIGPDFTDAFQELNQEQLKSNALSITSSYSYDATSYSVFRLSYSADGDYNHWMSFDPRYAIYKFYGMYARKPHDDLEWGLGVAAAKSFRRTGALPIILFNKNFTTKWGIESVLPIFVFGRYNWNRNNIFLFGVEYDSQSFRLDFVSDQQDFAYAYNHAELKLSGRLEHRLSSWIWANFKLGYQINFSSDFESKNDITPTFFADPTNALFFRIGVFLSPPDSMK